MSKAEGTKTSWQRSVLLILAITLHNIPEGLAIGVALCVCFCCRGHIQTFAKILSQPPGKKFSVIVYNRNGSRLREVPLDYILVDFLGTGYFFTKMLTGALLKSKNLPIEADRAVHLIKATCGYRYDLNQGIKLKKILNGFS